MATQPDTMRIWDAVSRTDPAHTKPVEFGRKFTAIDAHYQIMEATRIFGPIGEGWGYTTGNPMFEDGLVIVPVTLWHGKRDNTFGPIYGSTTTRDSKGKVDKDAPKKATTDAVTKGLSQLGFNADVFLGKFDDNKYVEQMRGEFAPADGGLAAVQPATISEAQRKEIMALGVPKGIDAREICERAGVASLKEMPADVFDQAKAWVARQKPRAATPLTESHASDVLEDEIPY